MFITTYLDPCCKICEDDDTIVSLPIQVRTESTICCISGSILPTFPPFLEICILDASVDYSPYSSKISFEFRHVNGLNSLQNPVYTGWCLIKYCKIFVFVSCISCLFNSFWNNLKVLSASVLFSLAIDAITAGADFVLCYRMARTFSNFPAKVIYLVNSLFSQATVWVLAKNFWYFDENVLLSILILCIALGG